MFKIPATADSPILAIMDKLYSTLKPFDVCLCGGSVLKAFMGESLDNSDFDFWFSNLEEIREAETVLVANGFSILATTENAVSLVSSDGVFDTTQITVQLIKVKFESICDILDSFDMDHVRIAYYANHFIMQERTLRAILTKEIRSLHTNDQFKTKKLLSRLHKYTLRGYAITDGAIRSAIDSGILSQYCSATAYLSASATDY